MVFFRQLGAGFWGLIAIVVFILIALFGGQFIADNTPNANRMEVSLANLKPNSSFQYILLKDNDVRLYIDSIFERGDSLYVYKYTGFDEVNKIDISKTALVLTSDQVLIKTQRFLFGTDQYGRDYLSRLVIGARISLLVGFASVIISLCIGVTIGAIAGFYGGKVDNLLTWFINVFWTLPTVLIVVAISFALGKGLWQIILAIGCSTWVDVARLVRGQVLGLKEKEYIQATKVLGVSDMQIIFKHILPNCLSGIIILSTANFASAILLEAGLSFLGFGVNPPTPSWGAMIKENYGNIVLDSYYLAIIPGLAIILVVFSFNIFANGLRKMFDER